MFMFPQTFVDVFAVVARLHKIKATFEDSLVLREEDGTESEVFSGWHSLKRLISKGGLDGKIGTVRIECLKPGAVTEWAKETGWKIVVPLVTNPLCLEYIRQQTVHMSVGAVFTVNAGELGCSANWGDSPRYRLVLDLKQAEKTDA
jgi:hypothetical protein